MWCRIPGRGPGQEERRCSCRVDGARLFAQNCLCRTIGKLWRSPRFVMEYRPTVIRTKFSFTPVYFSFVLSSEMMEFGVQWLLQPGRNYCCWAIAASLCWLLFMEPSPYCRAICFPYCPGTGLSSINYWLLLSFQLFLFVQRAASKASSLQHHF